LVFAKLNSYLCTDQIIYRMKEIALINGPNLNLTGIREPDVYGKISFDEYFIRLHNIFPDLKLIIRQTNVEGEIINWLQEFGFSSDGIVINPGGYSHTSVAIADAIRSIKVPVVEVHLSNVAAREHFRQVLITGAACKGVISGLGLSGYEMAVRYLIGG